LVSRNTTSLAAHHLFNLRSPASLCAREQPQLSAPSPWPHPWPQLVAEINMLMPQLESLTLHRDQFGAAHAPLRACVPSLKSPTLQHLSLNHLTHGAIGRWVGGLLGGTFFLHRTLRGAPQCATLACAPHPPPVAPARTLPLPWRGAPTDCQAAAGWPECVPSLLPASCNERAMA